jgi:glycosyltransferase involved in cell wall biosynthesis
MSKIGILAVSTPLHGGTFQYTMSMIDALQRLQEHQYTIFTTRDNGHYRKLGLPVVDLPSFASTALRAVLVKLFGVKRFGLFADIDKVIAPIYSARLLASSRPFAFTLHDLQERYFPEYFSVSQRLWRKFVNSALTRTAAVVVCESSNVKSDIERFLSVDASKISVLAAPPVSAFSEGQIADTRLAETKAVLGLPAHFIFYPAQFFPHKNHMRLVEAFAIFNRAHPHCHLVLTGQKNYEFEKVMQRVSELQIADRVLHLGYVETKYLGSIYKLATLLVVPTLFESVSIPIYEAFIVGTPVCASRVVALPEQVGDAGVLFDPTSVDDIAEKLADTFENDVLREQLVDRGKRRIAALTAENYAAELALVLERIR